MNKEQLKEKFLSQFEPLMTAKINPHLMGVIDENIESVLDGTTNIGGKKAETEEEIMQACNHGLIHRLGLYQGLMDGAKRFANKDTIVTVNYRNESVSFGG